MTLINHFNARKAVLLFLPNLLGYNAVMKTILALYLIFAMLFSFAYAEGEFQCELLFKRIELNV